MQDYWVQLCKVSIVVLQYNRRAYVIVVLFGIGEKRLTDLLVD